MKTSTVLLTLLSVPLTLAAPAPAPVAVPDDGFSIIEATDTRNDLTDGSPCKAVTVIFARGTTESGNVGSTVGPSFFTAISSAIGSTNLAVQGVPYAANIPGFLAGGDAAGSKAMAGLVNRAVTQCPNTKIVMSGYSQGGQLVHNAAKQLNAASTARVSAVVIFGDPFSRQAVGSIPASKVKIICHAGDNICAGGILVLPAHLTYAQDAKSAAAFVKSATGF